MLVFPGGDAEAVDDGLPAGAMLPESGVHSLTLAVSRNSQDLRGLSSLIVAVFARLVPLLLARLKHFLAACHYPDVDFGWRDYASDCEVDVSGSNGHCSLRDGGLVAC